ALAPRGHRSGARTGACDRLGCGKSSIGFRDHDPSHAERPRRQGPRGGVGRIGGGPVSAAATAAGAARIAEAFSSSGKRAALMPYLMGGYPDVAASLQVGQAFVEAGADLIELGVPFSDPLADGPVIQSAGQLALEAGATFERVVSEVAAPLGK